MRKSTINEFGGGLSKDFHEITTPNNILTDCVNGTTITFDGNEFMMQNDRGNIRFGDNVRLEEGFIPVGMKEFGGVIYVASYNPLTGEGELGSFPSPETLIDSTETGVFNQIASSDFTRSNENVVSSSVRADLVSELLDGLRSGDRYVLYYIDDVDNNGGTLLNKIQEGALRRDYRLRYYFVSENGNLNIINDINLLSANSVFVDPTLQDPQVIDGFNDFTVYKERERVKIAVQVIFETLDFFRLRYDVNINVLNNSKTVDLDAEFSHPSNVKARGFKFEYSKYANDGNVNPTTGTSYFNFSQNPTGSSSSIKARLADLEPNDRIDYTATPYSQYEMYPELAQSGSILTDDFIGPDGLFDVYRYFINENSMNLEFRYGFNGQSDNGFKNLYIEFYDLWSNHSMIREIGPYQSNNEILEIFNIPLINEPVSTVFNASSRGGTPVSKLSTQLPSSLDPTSIAKLNTGTVRYRTDNSLRKNHFYIIRISGVEEVNGSDIYHDVVYGLYTIPYFNNIYINNSITTTPSFANLPIDTSTIGYNMSLSVNSEVDSNSTQKNDNFDGNGVNYTTNNQVYNALSANQGETVYSDNQVLGTTLKTNIYNKTKSVNINRTFSSGLVYGLFNESTISLSSITNNSMINEVMNYIGTYRDNSYLSSNNLGLQPSSFSLSSSEVINNSFDNKIDRLSYILRTERAIQGKMIANTRAVQKQGDRAIRKQILFVNSTTTGGDPLPGFLDDDDWVREWIRTQCGTSDFEMPEGFVAWDMVGNPDRYRLFFRHGTGNGFGHSLRSFTNVGDAAIALESFRVRTQINDTASIVFNENGLSGYSAHGEFSTSFNNVFSSIQTKVNGPAFRTCRGSTVVTDFTSSITSDISTILNNDPTVNLMSNSIGANMYPQISAGTKTLTTSVDDIFENINANDLISTFQAGFDIAENDDKYNPDSNIQVGLFSINPDYASWSEYFDLTPFTLSNINGGAPCFGSESYTDFPIYTGDTETNGSATQGQWHDTLIDLI